MESSDLKPTPPDDAALETWLRTNGTLPPLPDEGFSRRVLTALPPPDRRHLNRWWFCLAGLLAGSAVALAGLPTAGEATGEISSVAWEQPLFSPPAFVALAVTVFSLGCAFYSQVRLLMRSFWA